MTGSIRGILRGALLTGAIALAPLTLGAQSTAPASLGPASLVGTVKDSAETPIPGVSVRLKGTEVVAQSDERGSFRLSGLPLGNQVIEIRRLGFRPRVVNVRLRAGAPDSLVVTLDALAARLAGVIVEDEYDARSKRMLAGFWDRRSHGFGSFVTRDEIESRDPSTFVEIVRRIPSVQVRSINGRDQIRFNRTGSFQRDCPPQYWVDGMRIENATPDEFSPQDVEAVEIYPGTATLPPQFAPRLGSYTCGAVVIWTRIPGA